MRPGQAGGVLPFLGSSGPVEMAVDALNLFLIKEKAPACVRDELLERELGRRSQKGATKWGVFASLRCA